MVAALSALPFAAAGAVGFRRSSGGVRQAIKDFPSLSSCSHVNAGFRSVNAVNLPKIRRGPVFASETNQTSTDRNENKIASSGPDSPPPATILFAVVLFLLFAFLLGSFVLWIVGLFINVPKS